MNKIAIITANTGSIDGIEGIPRQTVPADFCYYNDHNLPYPLPNLDNRLKSKYIKIQTHKFLEGYDIQIWIDSRVKIISKTFVQEFVLGLEENDMVMFKHPSRETIKDEMNYIISQMKEGNHYLLHRYGDQQMEKESLFYSISNTENSPLYACTVFARKVNDKTNEAFNQWWEKCIQFSNFDQTMFAHIAVKNDLKIQALEMSKWLKQLRINKHLL